MQSHVPTCRTAAAVACSGHVSGISPIPTYMNQTVHQICLFAAVRSKPDAWAIKQVIIPLDLLKAR